MSTVTVTSNDPGTIGVDAMAPAAGAATATGVGEGALVSSIEIGEPSVTPAAEASPWARAFASATAAARACAVAAAGSATDSVTPWTEFAPAATASSMSEPVSFRLRSLTERDWLACQPTSFCELPL